MYIKCLYKQLSGQWTIQYHYHKISTILSISWTEGYSEHSPNNGHEIAIYAKFNIQLVNNSPHFGTGILLFGSSR